MFSPNIYDGGATVLFALRQVIGERRVRDAPAGLGRRSFSRPLV